MQRDYQTARDLAATSYPPRDVLWAEFLDYLSSIGTYEMRSDGSIAVVNARDGSQTNLYIDAVNWHECILLPSIERLVRGGEPLSREAAPQWVWDELFELMGSSRLNIAIVDGQLTSAP